MRSLFYLLSFAASLLLLSTCDSPTAPMTGEDGHAHHAQPTDGGEVKVNAKSPHTTAMGDIGGAHVHVAYSSPSVRGRTVWGGLVAYDRVWSTGAHEATAVTFSAPMRVANTEIGAGTYALFTIPGREEWTVILNENYDQHLADDYDEGRDVLRLRVRPEKLDRSVESLTYEVIPTGEGEGALSISWDSIRVSLPLSLQ